MPEVLLIVCAIISIGIVLAMAGHYVTRRLPRRRRSSSHLDELSDDFHDRLLSPDFPAMERLFGGPVASSLRALYRDREEITRHDFELILPAAPNGQTTWYVAFYEPADADGLKEFTPGAESLLNFANDGSGNAYLVDPSEEDPVVYFYDIDANQKVRVSPTLSEFTAASRHSADISSQMPPVPARAIDLRQASKTGRLS